MWADRRLPPLLPENTSGDRRSGWVYSAVRDAETSLKKAEKVGRSNEIGVEEVKFRNMRNRLENDINSNATRTKEAEDEDNLSWQ